MQDERQMPIDYAFHKAEAKRLRAEAVDGLFRQLRSLASARDSWRPRRFPQFQTGQ